MQDVTSCAALRGLVRSKGGLNYPCLGMERCLLVAK